MYLVRLLIIFLVTAATAPVVAQVSATFVLPDVRSESGSTVCLPVTTEDFTAGIEFSFALRTSDNGVLTFNRVQNLNSAIPNFGMEDFNLTDFLGEGIITVDWRNYRDDQQCFEAASVVTIDDGEPLFEVCYDVSGPLTSFAEVTFVDKDDSNRFDAIDDSVPIAFNKRPQCDEAFDAFPGIVQGSVTVGVDPLILRISEQRGVANPGDPYCVDIVVESGFNELSGFQFGLLFDPSILSASSSQAMPVLSDGGNLASNSFDGTQYFNNWNVGFSNTPLSVGNGTTLLQVCFDVIGECGEGTDIRIGEILADSGSPRATEASTAETDNIPIISRDASFGISRCNPVGFDVFLGCPDPSPMFGERNVCVEVQAGDDFIDMNRMNYAVAWNANVLRFTGIGSTNPAVLIDQSDDFILDRTEDGILFFDWDPPGSRQVSLANGDVVYTICFEVIGFGGVSPITVAEFRNNNVSASAGAYNGINSRNCAIEVGQPPGVAVSFPTNNTFRSSEDNCVDLTVEGFVDVNRFTLNFSTPNTIAYQEFNPAFPGIVAMQLSGGEIEVRYNGPTLTIEDGASLGELCYRARMGVEAPICDSDSLRLVPNGLVVNEVFTRDNPTLSAPIQDFAGEVCVVKHKRVWYAESRIRPRGYRKIFACRWK